MVAALCEKAKPSAGARNGAVQGVAKVVARTPLKNAPGCAVLRCEISGGVQSASAKRDFKHAEQVQRDQRDERSEADDENRAAKLHPPTSLMSGGLDANDDGREDKE